MIQMPYNPWILKMQQIVLTNTTEQVAKCPVCNGSGKYTEYHHKYERSIDRFDYYFERTCHGCDGKGWVCVHTVYGIK